MAFQRIGFFSLGLVILQFCLSADEIPTVKLEQTISLPGVIGRYDHFAFDIQGRRLYVAALGNNTLEALDLAAGKRLQSIAGLGKPAGGLYLPDLKMMLS